ncbi:hypothetical protein PMZ80_003704 [Knufia obscura]|uniref:Uncharacterized protein n=2 Tax=Knufia TaxID=430999 RepID=A0AAN8I958_9EURO|nr:hypothetical protein PMZ80_003704 [Knufia obscura]KAK5958384.1 hypothetical protein OHC33_000226 [Knufia fluminis]
MASSNAEYAAIAHNLADGDQVRGLQSSTLTPSPTLPELLHTPLSSAFEDLADGTYNYFDEPATTQKPSVSSVLKSLSGSQRSTQSYELVEEDDYEQSQITPRLPVKMSELMENGRPHSSKEDTPVRTASISRHLPLHNPTPDLQSLQGAYLKNVQALEDTAERMSMSSSMSMEEELQRIKHDLRRSESKGSHTSPVHARNTSSHSMAHSIISVNAEARSGGYSPAGYVASPIGSLQSRRFSQRGTRMSNAPIPLPEPELEGRPLESAMVHSPPAHAMQPRQSSESHRSLSQASHYDRPGTSNSNDTYRQAQHLFTDFDGTHFSPIEEGDVMSRRISLSHPPLARDSRVFREAQPDHKMVYYPAPVPVMLNLPKRLSKHNWAQQEKRRTQVISGIPQEIRKSAAWLADADEDAEYKEEPERPRNRMSALPSQLRASAFFDAPGTQTDVKLKHGSAVITLDSILDAAAHAPVSAFTDHPIAGHLGHEVYGVEPGHRKKSSETKAKRRSSLSNMLTKRKSSATMSGARRVSQNLDNEIEVPEDDPERAGERSLAPDADELVEGEKQEGEHSGDEASEKEEQESEHELGFLGAPTTLLAELQMRKAQQKLRNTTAANVAPGGMHSTLLELDAVRQLQQKARKQKHVALAWEDQEAVDKANFDDEDVPLGVLFPEKEKKNHVNLHKPLGLMEKRELEENEPLSFRRARLRGEPYKPPVPAAQPSPGPEESAPAVRIAGVDDYEEEENEGETLAERRKRIQEKKDRRASLADDIASQLGLEPETIGGTKTPEPELEETLGQRRKRLQAEAEQKATPLKAKTSMGDLLRANPVGDRSDSRQASAESKVSLLMNRRDSSMPLVGHIQAAQPGSKALPTAHANPPPYFPSQPLLQQHQHQQQQQQQMPYQQRPPMGQYQYSGYSMPQIQPMQSMPNLNIMNTNYNSFAPQQSPYMQNNMSHMSLGMNNMYNPMQMNMMGMSGMQMPMGGYAAPAYDAIGMGPPLTGQQRASIDRWRQGIA